MKTSYLAAILVISCLHAVRAQGIDLTPRYDTVNNDGIVMERPYFSDGEKRYAFSIDRQTKLSAGERGALFRFQKFVGAQFEIRHSPFSPEQSFESNLSGYRATALICVAPGATDVKVESEISDPLTVNGWHSYRFVLTYLANSQQIKECITFLNLDAKQQVLLRATSSDKDFAEADGRAAHIMNSWYKMLPQDLKQTGS